MYFVIALFYLMLCMPVVLRTDLGLNNTETSMQTEISFCGLSICYSAKLMITQQPLRVKWMRRYPGKEKKQAERQIRKTAKRIKNILLSFARTRGRKEAYLDVRVGLQDAAECAVAAGMFRMIAETAFALLPDVSVKHISIQPDFCCAGFVLCFCGIVSVSPGDIMAAVLNTAWTKKRKEGLRIGKASY